MPAGINDYGSAPEPVCFVTEAVEMARAVVPPEKLVLGISTPGETPESLLTKAGIAKRYNLSGIDFNIIWGNSIETSCSGWITNFNYLIAPGNCLFKELSRT